MKIKYNGKVYEVIHTYKLLNGKIEYSIRLDNKTFLLVKESEVVKVC